MTGSPDEHAAMLAVLKAEPGVTLKALKARFGWSLGRCSRIRASVAAANGLAISGGGHKGDLRTAADRLLTGQPDLSPARLAAVLGCDRLKAAQLRRDVMLRRRIDEGEPLKLSSQAVGFTAMVETARARAAALIAGGAPPDAAALQVNAEYPEARLRAADLANACAREVGA